MRLKKLEVAQFGGINADSPIVIDFTQSKFVLLEGDQGKNKTTLLNSLLLATGSIGAPDAKINKNFVNTDSGKIDVNFSFVGNDRNSYSVRCTRSSFSLTCEGVKVDEPMTQMKKLLGVVGISPIEIKYKPLTEIIKWLAGYSNKSAEEFENQFAKFKAGIKAAREARASANKSLKSLDEYLSNEDLFINWEESEKKYAKAVDIKELSQKLDSAGKKSDDLLKYETGIKQLVSRKTQIEDQINLLVKEAQELDGRIKKGEKFIEDNKGAKKEYDIIKKQYDTAAEESVAFRKWQEIKEKKSNRDEFETMSQKADSQEKKILQSLKELQAELLPDVRGVELVTDDTHEDGGVMKKEGLYWNGKNFAQLSESETWDLVMQIWRKYKVRIVVIDNYSNLGSKAVEILEKLTKDGAYILAAQMDRTKQELEIIYE